MHRIGQSEYPRAITASLWNAAVAIGLVIGLALPVAGSPSAEEGNSRASDSAYAASMKSEVAAYDNYLHLVKRAALLRIGASEGEAADIVTIQQMLAGYRELHAQAVVLHRAGDVDQARRMTELCTILLDEIRHAMTEIGQNAGIGQDETAPVRLTAPPVVVAAR
jgi:hypothetical protein